MNINGAFPSTYLKAADLEGKNVKVTIRSVILEEVGQDRKPILYFEGHEKGLVLNRTNSNTISDAYGPETDDWRGATIELFPAMVDFQGRSVEAIRVRVPRGRAVAQNSPQRPVEKPFPGDDSENPAPKF